MNTTIKNLGERRFISPLKVASFVKDTDRTLYDVRLDYIKGLRETGEEPISFEVAGPRKEIFFDPKETRCGIVTCGGLCPGLNNVIRSIVMESYYIYGVKEVLGFQYGYRGLSLKHGLAPILLTPEKVSNIHTVGGTILASSRGNQDPGDMVDTLEKYRVNILFAIGGDGTMRGAHAIVGEIERRGLPISVVGIPKTIDNDISYVAKSFGFETAFSEAVESIRSAHVEATGAPNGIGIVKLMGRHSGFIAANATLAWQDVNYVLIPEVDFDLDGERGLLNVLRERLEKRGHAVIVVAEGAGQKFFEDLGERDASGNIRLGDIGLLLKERIEEYFKGLGVHVNIKYIDPSYNIRSIPASPDDSVFCTFLAQSAVHAGMAGKTDLLIGVWNNIFTHIPIELAISKRKTVDPRGRLWQCVLSATGQPSLKN
ncbi:MAG: ATP-dependent 6-phosphofructokinase [bacterium]